jgi:hypothetical protein
MDTEVMKKIFEIASHITDPVTATVFAATFFGIALVMVIRWKNQRIVILVAVCLFLVGLAPLAAVTFLSSKGVYHVRLVVIAPNNQLISDAEIKTSVGGEIKRTESGWEIDIPPQTKPADGEVRIYANVPSSFLKGQATAKLDRYYFQSIELHVSNFEFAKIHGQVLDETQHSVANADVTLPACSQSVKSDTHGLFEFDLCVPQGQMVTIRAQKGRFSTSVTVLAGDTADLMLTDSPSH